ncbi:hypothetical protein DMA11_12550 [Marinilabiliaceae bacterium JC017]|nr:hypothetical protein DMA11_12550 [Marinilabiliaceae bacterium JC017]
MLFCNRFHAWEEPGTFFVTDLAPGKSQVATLKQKWNLGRARMHFCHQFHTWGKPGYCFVTELAPGSRQVSFFVSNETQCTQYLKLCGIWKTRHFTL